MNSRLLRVHDLLGPLKQGVVRAENPAEQSALDACLECAPFAVVRRCESLRGEVPVGVRGHARTERFAGWMVDVDCAVHAPETLRMQVAELPAIAALGALQERWRDLPFAWGPTGSVGFQLASGAEVVTVGSDLDVMLRADERLSAECAREILRQTMELPASVDVLVETPLGGVALAELAQGGARVMLRTLAGAKLVHDPWTAEVMA